MTQHVCRVLVAWPECDTEKATDAGMRTANEGKQLSTLKNHHRPAQGQRVLGLPIQHIRTESITSRYTAVWFP